MNRSGMPDTHFRSIGHQSQVLRTQGMADSRSVESRLRKSQEASLLPNRDVVEFRDLEKDASMVGSAVFQAAPT